MKNNLLPTTLRLLLFIAPLLLFYLYTQNAFQHARLQGYRGDTGLGIALLLGFLAIIMLTGFLIDLIIQLCRKELLNAFVDTLILLLLLMPFGWVTCHWFGPPDHSACRIPLALFGQVLHWLQL